MNSADGNLPPDVSEPVQNFVDQWTASLAQVLESMTDHKPGVTWRALSGSLPDVRGPQEANSNEDGELLWWDQPFQTAPPSCVWVAAPRGVWEYAGTLTLKAAGLETVEAKEAHNTWLEILGQSLGTLAQSLSAMLGREVVCETGAERAPEPDPQEWVSVSIAFDEKQLPPLWFALSSSLTQLIAAPPTTAPLSANEAVSQPSSDQQPPSSQRSRTMELLLDVDLPVSISFGRTQLPLKDVLKLTTGSIVELNRHVNDPVEVLVNQCLIARGEVVVVEGNYGVRIQEIASRQDRLRSIA